MARYKDRKLNRMFTFVGSDVYADGTARGQAKNVYEPGSNIINNWDVMEGVLDYVFVKLSIDGNNGGIDRPVVITEPVANLGYSRKSKQPPMMALVIQTDTDSNSNVRDTLRMLFRAQSGVWNRFTLLL